MKFEHFALNVPEPIAQAQWYVDHVGFTILKKNDAEPFAHFLGDETGRIAVELYRNTKAAIPDYTAGHPLTFHVAVVSRDAKADSERLQQAGASLFLEDLQPDGSLMVMMRDPWGVPLQLCQRATPFRTP